MDALMLSFWFKFITALLFVMMTFNLINPVAKVKFVFVIIHRALSVSLFYSTALIYILVYFFC